MRLELKPGYSSIFMHLKKLQRLNGLGFLTREGEDTKLADVGYDLAILQEMIPVAGDEEVEGMKQIQGLITPLTGYDLFTLIDEDKLVLHLADGQRLGMFITDTNTGAIANRTGFYTVPKP